MRRGRRLSLLVLVLAVAACGGAPTQAQKESHAAKADADGVQRIRIAAGSYFFKPNHIVVKANVPVELVATREPGMTPHDLVIREPDGGVVAEEDLSTDPKKIAFTPKKTGLYSFYCSKKLPFTTGHRERGMEGVLEVRP
jgi:plastocyanin domain-containing protein